MQFQQGRDQLMFARTPLIIFRFTLFFSFYNYGNQNINQINP